VKIHTRPCIRCKQRSVIVVEDREYERWRAGAFVQDAFPNLSLTSRELIVSGTHEACWRTLFGEEEEYASQSDDSCGK